MDRHGKGETDGTPQRAHNTASARLLRCLTMRLPARDGRICVSVLFFFFQAEDGIRDESVTGVQTCALPIEEDGIRDESVTGVQTCALPIRSEEHTSELQHTLISYAVFCLRSEERRQRQRAVC